LPFSYHLFRCSLALRHLGCGVKELVIVSTEDYSDCKNRTVARSSTTGIQEGEAAKNHSTSYRSSKEYSNNSDHPVILIQKDKTKKNRECTYHLYYLFHI